MKKNLLKQLLLCALLMCPPQILFAENENISMKYNCKELNRDNSLSIDETKFTEEEMYAVDALNQGADVTNLCVDTNVISFVRNVCIVAGRTPQFSKRVNTCVDGFIKIERAGLNVRSYGRDPVLTGNPVVVIEGEISSEMLSSLDEYPLNFRQDLQRQFQRRAGGNRTNFPVKIGFTPSKISNALRTLSKD